MVSCLLILQVIYFCIDAQWRKQINWEDWLAGTESSRWKIHCSGEAADYTCVALSGYIVDICQDTALNITDKIFAALLR